MRLTNLHPLSHWVSSLTWIPIFKWSRIKTIRRLMNKASPIMCSLSTNELNDRGREWRLLLDSGLIERVRVPGGVRLIAAQGALESLLKLIESERECCPWINFDVAESVVTLTADGDAATTLANLFLPDESGMDGRGGEIGGSD